LPGLPAQADLASARTPYGGVGVPLTPRKLHRLRAIYSRSFVPALTSRSRCRLVVGDKRI